MGKISKEQKKIQRLNFKALCKRADPADSFTLMILVSKLYLLMFKFFSICRKVSSSFGKTCPFLTKLFPEKVTSLKSFLAVVPYPYVQNEYRSFVKDTNILDKNE